MAMNDGVLHEATERRQIFSGSRVVSLLDILGGGNVTCCRCGRWQTFACLGRRDAQKYLSSFGWTFARYLDVPPPPCPTCGHIDDDVDYLGIDVCPRCSKDKPATSADAVDPQGGSTHV